MKHIYKFKVTMVVAMSIILLCIALFIFAAPNAVAYAADGANQSEASNYDAYTDTDTYIFENKEYTIRQYGAIYKAKSNITRTGSTYNLTVSGDDPITQIIPKELFTYAAECLYIGKEYGFYIKTFVESGTQNKRSEILVFDIINNISYTSNNGVLDFEVTPLFQYEYVYLTSANINFKISSNTTVQCSIPAGQTYVVPIPVNNNSTITYMQMTKYSLKNISYDMSLLNEQEPNSGNGEFYTASQDLGAYFTYFDYKYNGHYVDEHGEEIAYENVGGFITSLLQFVLSGITFVNPPVGFALNAIYILGQAINIAGIESNLIELDNSVENYLTPENISVNNGQITASNFYANRDDQIAYYGGIMNEAVVCVAEHEGINILYGIGEYAKGYFQIGHSALNTQANLIRLTRTIGLTVTDGNTQNDKTALSSYGFNVREPNYKPIKVDNTSETNVFLLPDGTNYFSFTPDYSSHYTFGFDGEGDVDIYVNNVKQTVSNNQCTIYLSANSTNSIKIKRTGHGAIGNFSVSPSQNLSNIPLPAESSYLVKYKPATSGVVTLTPDSGAKIADVLKLNANGNFYREPLLDFFTATDKLSVYLHKNETYYILLRNQSSASITSTTDVAATNEVLSTGDNLSKTIKANDNFKYFKFVVPNNGVSTYKFLFSGILNETDTMSFRVLDANGKICNIISYSYGYLEALSLNPNATYYIGVKTNASKSINSTVKVTKSDLNFAWKVYNSTGILMALTSPTEIILSRGTTYVFQLWINDNVKVRQLNSINDSGNGLVMNNNTGQITISADRYHNDWFTVAGLKQDDSIYIYTYTLKVIPQFNQSEIVFNDIDYMNATKVSWQGITHLELIKYKVVGKNPQNVPFNFTGETPRSSLLVDVLPQLIQKAAYSDVTFTIYSIKLESGTNTYTEIEVNRSISINCQFSRYGSEKPLWATYYYHYFGNALHLKNSQYYGGRSLKAECVISLELYPNWVPIPEFNNNLTASTITNLNININSSNVNSTDYFGLIGVNNGNILLLIIEDINITSSALHNTSMKYVGGIAGKNSSSGGISLSKVTGNILVHMQNSSVGGIVGINEGNMLSPLFGDNAKPSKIFGNGDLGGIAGQNYSDIGAVQVTNSRIELWIVYTNRSAGGLVGFNGGGEISGSVKAVEIAFVGSDMNPNNLRPNMGIIVGHVQNSKLLNCSRDNAGVNIGSLTANQRVNCANGPQGMMGYIGPNVTLSNTPSA